MSLHLRTYFAIICAVLILLTTVILSVAISRKSSNELKSEIGNSLAGVAHQMADKLDHFMWSRTAEFRMLSRSETLREPHDLSLTQQLLEQLQEAFPAFSWVGLTDARGIVQASTDSILKGVDLSARPVFTAAQEGLYIGDAHEAMLLATLLSNHDGEPLKFVDISLPVTDSDGQFIGVLAAHLSWSWVKEVKASIVEPLKVNRNQHTEVIIVSKQDNTVLLGPPDLVGRPLQLDSIAAAQQGQNSWTIEQWPNGQSYLTGYAYGAGYKDYAGLGWTILVIEPAKSAFQGIRDLSNFIWELGTLAVILFAAIGWFLAGQISKPLYRISNTANKIRSGDIVVIPHYKGIRDIEILSTSLRELLATLIRTENKLDKMESLALHDSLTGLPNRIALDAYLEDKMRLARSSGLKMVFLYMDLDGFKQVNDTYGHYLGDLLLKQVAERISADLPNHEFLCRLGGDEFILIHTPQADPLAESEAIANRIIDALNRPFPIEGHTIAVGCSIGAAIWPDDESDPIKVMRAADSALYHSKSSGKNRLTFFK